MKLSLVNLVPLREESMQARKLASTYKLSQLQKMLDQRLGPDQESSSNMSDFDPNEFSSSEDFGPSANDLERAIALKQPKQPYDVAIGKMTQDEYDEYMSTVKPDRDSFEKNSKFSRHQGVTEINESTEDAWNAIKVSRKAEKELDKELDGTKQWNARTDKKLAMLKAMNKAGKFKKNFDDDTLMGWVEQDYSWERVSRQFDKPKLKEIKNNKQKNLLTERFQELAGIKPLYEDDPEAIKGKHYPDEETVKKLKKGPYTKGGQNAHLDVDETMQQGDYSAVEQGWDGLSPDEQISIIGDAMNGEARPNDIEKSFDQLKSEIPDFESGVANYLGIDEGEDLTFEPEDMDNPDEDLVIIGSGYLDIKSKFGERPSQTNGEYAEIGQKVVDQLHKGDKEAAMDYIMSKINEVDEGSCGYSQDAPGGEELDTPGGIQGMDADTRTKGMLKQLIQKEIKKLTVGKAPITKEGKPGDFDKGLEDLLGKDDFQKAISKPVPSLADMKPKPRPTKSK